MKSFFKNKKIIKGGFTLVELLITLSIFAVTTTIVMFSQSQFDNSVILTNLAYDVAVTLRQAQTYGVNVKEFVPASGARGFYPYGIFFSTSDINHYIMFADTVGGQYVNGSYVGDNLYESMDMSCSASDSECINRYSVKNGNYIYSICAGASDTTCNQNAPTTGQLMISFNRPDSDAKIFWKSTTGLLSAQQNYAKIVVSSSNGVSRKSIIITGTGQIYVK